ncbi:hypothetical protein EGC79_11050 [Shewanella vesiculosa]|uniref:hypothetical protein n=1 Tax=Shewanella vesiculosa TaxID=518738 RepID=UPI000F4F79DA|nr:hypothetical protein [Shewanella vesiculosa]RPA50621.1 hypothetical protein EGC79_11050 [Shewanella vesiculosa]UJL44377.1 hypothetical protein KDH10_001874 [Shewanella vesiculosa]
MNDDKKMGIFISFSFPLCLGLILGLIIFNPSEGFIIWWKTIDWNAQSVANVGAWVAGIATSLAALATASAARSSSKAADAATQAANQWKEHASYEKYIDVGVKARIKLRWLEAHLQCMCEKEFQVFFDNESVIAGDYTPNSVNSFLICLDSNSVYEGLEAYDHFKKYKKVFKYQSDAINNLYPEIFNLIEETFELSKNHIGLSETEKNVIHKTIEKLITQIRIIGGLYENVIEKKHSNNSKKIDIDSCLNCIDSSRHYYFSTLSNLKLISGYIDNLVIDSDVVSWEKTKKNHILEQQDIHRIITKDKGGFNENIITYLNDKFDNK